MAIVNGNYAKLQDSYLFTDIAKRVAAFTAAHPEKKIIKMGIGDVTLPLAPCVVDAMKKAVEELGHKETFRGYGPEQGYQFLIEKIIEGDEEWDESIFEFMHVPTMRKWSTALAQQGFPLSAVLLRRKLVEDNLMQARSANYKYAVSDLKKSLDYMEHLSVEHQQLIPSTLEYITALHEKHQRKYAFWNACVDFIPEEFTKSGYI